MANSHEFEQLVSTPQLDEAATALYAALTNVRELGLGLRRADDSEHQEKLEQIAKEMGYEGEFMINEMAISRGVQFFPKYLNDSLVDYPDGRSDGPFPRLRADT